MTIINFSGINSGNNYLSYHMSDLNGQSPLIRVNNLSVTYGKITVLDHISLQVAKNRVVALLGANGAGKSTLLKTIIGVVRPSEGEVVYQDTLLNDKSTPDILRMGIGFVPQKEKIFPNLSVAENILISLPGTDVQQEAASLRLEQILEIFPQLRSKLKSKAGSLSGGEQQLVSICRALLHSPRLLLIDELSIGVARPILDQIAEKLIRNRPSDLGILMVEQNVEWALNVADEVYILKLGNIALHSTTPTQLSQEELRKAFLD